MKIKQIGVTKLGLFLFISIPAFCQPVSFNQTKRRGVYTRDALDKTYIRYGHIDAFIGRRRSMKEGERSSLRWLSRLVKQHPMENEYLVEWYLPIGNKKWLNVATSFDKGSLGFSVAGSENNSALERMETGWDDIDEYQIHEAARKGQTFKAFGKKAGK